MKPIIEFEETLPYECQVEFNSVLELVLGLMPINKVNADRLYRFFIDDMQNFNVFVRLMTECREFLSDTQYRGLKEKGRSFDKEILKNCIDDWDED